jgi:DNA-binding response OmpR family regulator
VKLITQFPRSGAQSFSFKKDSICAVAPKIIVFSDDSDTRASIISALGKQVSPDVAPHEILEFATGPALRQYLDGKGKADLFILDGEAAPEGGMGIARQLKDEIFNCPPVLLIIARQEDQWLASWSRAEEVVLAPIDPFTFANRVAGLLTASSVATR